MITRIGTIVLVLLAMACHGAKETTTKEENASGAKGVTGPPLLVYRTRENVNDLVPVLLSPDGKSIVSYPHPNDLRLPTGYSTPTPLHRGYLLDNRGINANVAFLNITYPAYAALAEPPSMDKLLGMIKFKDPLVELCDCGNRSRFTDLEKELNEMIDKDELKKNCKTLK